MSTIAPLSATELPTIHTEFAYLLLGDLRQLLEEPVELPTSRWLIAVIDCLLEHRVSLDLLLADGDHRSDWCENGSAFCAKLQRLRDRVAHRKPYVLLANEVRCDLSVWLAPGACPQL